MLKSNVMAVAGMIVWLIKAQSQTLYSGPEIQSCQNWFNLIRNVKD